MTQPNTIRPYPIKAISCQLIEAADNPLAEAVLDSVASHHDTLRGRRIWLACSGGRDSLALAAICAQLYHRGQLPFLPQLLHVDHGLQEISGLWARHVAAWAKAQGMSCTVLSACVQGGDEQAARLARYESMRAQMNQGDVLMLAHHMDDQAETVLMRLIDGAGVAGLSGMRPWHWQTRGKHSIALWRPWLGVRRSAISNYAKRLQLPYIDDPTNTSGDNVRSGLRYDILPRLGRYNSNVVANIARSASLLSDANTSVREQAKQDEAHVCIDTLTHAPEYRALDINSLQKLPDYRQRQLLHFWLTHDEPLPPSKQLIDDVLHLAKREDHNHQTRLNWYAKRRTYQIRRHRKCLYRISDVFLDTLNTPIQSQTIALNSLPHNAYITIQHADIYLWQCHIDVGLIQSYYPWATDLTITPFNRNQKLSVGRKTHAQSGKKLFQTLGVPTWLRDSLVVVSVVTQNQVSRDQSDGVQPLGLLSPMQHWDLCDHHAIIDQQLVGHSDK